MQQVVTDRIPTGNALRASVAQPVGKVIHESLVIQEPEPGTSDERTGHPQGGGSEMSSYNQQGMSGREVKGREVLGTSYPRGAPLQQARLRASTKPGSDHDCRPYISRFSIFTTVPPAPDPQRVLPRADDVSTILRMLSEPRTSALILSGEPGAGKSTLAALVYHHLQSVQDASNRAGTSAVRHFVWLSLGPHATLPDVIAAILSGVDRYPADFFLLKPEQQMALLVQALGRPQENAFIVLDQFEELLNPETTEGLPGRGAIGRFFETLRDADIGASRLLLTSYRSPNSVQNGESFRIRSYLVSRISIPEGLALLQQRGVQGSHSELSLVWQRCGGHIFALIFFSMLTRLSGFSLSYLLSSPDYFPMWNGEVTRNLIGTLYYYLNPVQRTLMRALCLFAEPVPLDAIATAIMGEEGAINQAPAGDSHNSAYNGSPYMAFQRELSALVGMYLVQEQSKGIGQHTYFLHPLLRSYTVEHYLEGSERGHAGQAQGLLLPTDVLGVAAPPDAMVRNPEAWQIALAAGHMRVAAYYARQAQEFCPPRKERTGLADVEPIVAMIRHLCLGWHWQEAYNLLCAEELCESMLQWGALNALIGLYTAMLPPLGVLSRSDCGEVCGKLGMLYGRLGEDVQSRAYYEQALGVFREVGNDYAEAVTLSNQGELFRSRGEWEKARSNFEQALLLNRQFGDEHLQSVILHNLGLLFQMSRNYAYALRCYVESLKIAHVLQEQYNEGMILSNMGFLLYEQGHLPEAIALLSYSVQMRQSLHDATVSAVIDFLNALEQKMGSEAFARLRSTPATNYNLGTDDLISRLLSAGTQ